MCYSAQIRADYRDYTRMFGAHVSIREFVDIFYRRAQAKLKIPKGMELAFEQPSTPEELEIKTVIDAFRQACVV
jgi:hypothetical protein